MPHITIASDKTIHPEELAYKTIIGKYARAIQDTDFLKYPTLNILSLQFRESKDWVIQYAFFDIDENGTNELLLQLNKKESYATTQIMDVYTFDGERAVKFFQNEKFDLDTLAERSTLHIYDDGEMYIYGSNGAAYGSASFYKIDVDGYSCVLTDEYDVNHYDFPETPYRNATSQLSTEEFQNLLNHRQELTDFIWQDIQESDLLFEAGFEIMEIHDDNSNTFTEMDLNNSRLYELAQTYFHSEDILNRFIRTFSLSYNSQELDAFIDIEKVSYEFIRVKFYNNDKMQCEKIRDELLNAFKSYLNTHGITISILTQYIK